MGPSDQFSPVECEQKCSASFPRPVSKKTVPPPPALVLLLLEIEDLMPPSMSELLDEISLGESLSSTRNPGKK